MPHGRPRVRGCAAALRHSRSAVRRESSVPALSRARRLDVRTRSADPVRRTG